MSKSSKTKTLVKCPKCNCSIRSDRLETHLSKVHKQQKRSEHKINRSTENRTKSIYIAPLNYQKFERVFSVVQMWRIHDDYGEESLSDVNPLELEYGTKPV